MALEKRDTEAEMETLHNEIDAEYEPMVDKALAQRTPEGFCLSAFLMDAWRQEKQFADLNGTRISTWLK